MKYKSIKTTRSKVHYFWLLFFSYQCFFLFLLFYIWTIPIIYLFISKLLYYFLFQMSIAIHEWTEFACELNDSLSKQPRYYRTYAFFLIKSPPHSWKSYEVFYKNILVLFNISISIVSTDAVQNQNANFETFQRMNNDLQTENANLICILKRLNLNYVFKIKTESCFKIKHNSYVTSKPIGFFKEFRNIFDFKIFENSDLSDLKK